MAANASYVNERVNIKQYKQCKSVIVTFIVTTAIVTFTMPPLPGM